VTNSNVVWMQVTSISILLSMLSMTNCPFGPSQPTTTFRISVTDWRGEADSLLGAIERCGTLATDDLAARKMAAQRDIPVTGSIVLLVLCVESEYIDHNTADEWLDTWRERRGYYAPVESVTEILNDEG